MGILTRQEAEKQSIQWNEARRLTQEINTWKKKIRNKHLNILINR